MCYMLLTKPNVTGLGMQLQDDTVVQYRVICTFISSTQLVASITFESFQSDGVLNSLHITIGIDTLWNSVVVVVAFLSWTLSGSPGICTHTCTCTSTGTLHRVRGLRVRPFSMTPPCRQPHSVFGGLKFSNYHCPSDQYMFIGIASVGLCTVFMFLLSLFLKQSTNSLASDLRRRHSHKSVNTTNADPHRFDWKGQLYLWSARIQNTINTLVQIGDPAD